MRSSIVFDSVLYTNYGKWGRVHRSACRKLAVLTTNGAAAPAGIVTGEADIPYAFCMNSCEMERARLGSHYA